MPAIKPALAASSDVYKLADLKSSNPLANLKPASPSKPSNPEPKNEREALMAELKCETPLARLKPATKKEESIKPIVKPGGD